MSLNAAELLDSEFLELRAKVLEVGAALDRLDRAGGSLAGDPRMELLRQALTQLASTEAGRAERIQLVFSLPYDKDWRKQPG